MSWFDKLFGEDNDSNEDILRNKNKRRQANQSNDTHHDSLLPQNNDIYHRPKGKFRFPMEGFESGNAESENTTTQDVHQSNVNHDIEEFRTQDNKRHRRRRNHDNEDGSFDSSYQSKGYQSRKKKDPNPYATTSTHRQISPTSLGSSSTKNHKTTSNTQPRMKLQSERFKSNYKTQSEYTYHKSDFKASEVPSAIFGTKQRRPIENGVIPPKDGENDSTHIAEEKRNDRDYVNNNSRAFSSDSKTHAQPQQQDSQQSNHNTNNEELSTDNEYVKTPTTPNHSKKDNTININNIYASQIVEEIRRERERKVLQKRRFKKALQEKRQQNQESNEDSIQKAIDEMYAKQAQQYVGDSSLDIEDQEDLNDSDVNSNSNIEEDKLDDANGLDADNQEKSGHHYNYEEIDLNDITQRHEVNDDDVTVSDAVNHDHDNDSVQDQFEYHSIENTTEDEIVQQDSEDKTQSYDNGDRAHDEPELSNNVDDAEYREINESNSSANHVTSEPISTSQKTSEFQQKSSEQQSQQRRGHNAVTQSVDHEIEYAKKRRRQNDVASVATSSQSESTIENQSDSTENNYKTSNNDISTSSAKTMNTVSTSERQYESMPSKDDKSQRDNSSNYSSSESIHSSTKEQFESNSENTSSSDGQLNSQQTQHSSTPKKRVTGGKPFNVVMTPSDKKRMMDKNKGKKVNVPELTPEDKTQASRSSENVNSISSTTSTSTSESSSVHETNHSQENEQLDLSTPSTHSETVDTTSTESIHVDDNHSVVNKQNSSSHDNDNELNHHQDDSQVGINHLNEQETSGNSEEPQVQKPTIRKGPNIKLPSYDLLEEPEPHEVNEEWIDDKKQELNDALYYFNVPAEVQNVTEGPSVTRFELSVEKGVKVSRITALQDDIKMALAAKDIRIEAPIPGTSLVGIEVPNQNPAKVNLRSIVDSEPFKNAESKLTVAMGYRINNEPLLMDIAKTPHALIAGATGSGKSVCINSILMSLLYKNHPEELRLLLIDPKMVELAPYNDLPHLVSPVITDVKAATQSLKWAVEEMERRYKLFAQYHVRNITAFNKKASYEQRMPKIVIVIDELADLMMMAPQEVEQSIARIAQKARACGIHMLVATQRPSVNVITGLIKANIPTRIAFMVSSSVDSRTILDSGGAERLLGYGDMLYLGGGMNKPIRVQGTFVSDEEIDDVVDFIKQQREPEYLFEEKELLKKTQTQAQDDLFDDVCEFMINEGHISTSLVQRHFQIGYNRAARIIDQLEQLGYISGANGSKPRDVYITEADLNQD
ncbi:MULTISPECIES: DNA translocase FtsK [Staphylococcus]|uniref:DNA translocase FtsK n=2 Tax=Bacilli TaxID=91061 RepID=UPI000D1D6FE5|nr:DNA translocase FtsK [Staphylococcus warneri]MBX7840670.1 DNA translocase FtsK [Staphylococcus warneri]MCI2769858.1 DNA translocase FtsK [Staphylococcus warneri]MDK7947073.1 DNA translocase FtsK [Staphylococcus warneri]MDK8349678.1 DNA translocase FtsK [Staphylococcus warneri]MDK8369865.1 DNA translocase FtsK [Staphylococcus warneri]